MPRFLQSSLQRSLAAVTLAGAVALTAMPARAEWRGEHEGSHGGHGYHGGSYYHGGYGYRGGWGNRGGYGWGPGAIVGGTLLGLGIGAAVAGAYAPPVYYAPPPAYYPPPPVYVQPAPGYYAPY